MMKYWQCNCNDWKHLGHPISVSLLFGWYMIMNCVRVDWYWNLYQQIKPCASTQTKICIKQCKFINISRFFSVVYSDLMAHFKGWCQTKEKKGGECSLCTQAGLDRIIGIKTCIVDEGSWN